jgi:hypothetical protein
VTTTNETFQIGDRVKCNQTCIDLMAAASLEGTLLERQRLRHYHNAVGTVRIEPDRLDTVLYLDWHDSEGRRLDLPGVVHRSNLDKLVA